MNTTYSVLLTCLTQLAPALRLSRAYWLGTFILLFFASAGGYAQDSNEPNDAFETATVIPLEDLAAEIEGTIDPARDVDFYSFEVPRAGVVFAEMLAPGDIRPSIVLYDGSREDLERASGRDGESASLEELVCGSGTYYIRVADGSGLSRSNADPYTLRLRFDTTDVNECNNEFDRATPIVLGNSVSGTIRSGGDQDYFEFEVPRAGVVVAEMLAPADIRPSIVLYDDSREDLETASGRDGQSATLEELICGAGTYYIRLADGSGLSRSSPDPYTFTLRFDTTDVYECNDDFLRATPIALGDTLSGTIRSGGDQDYFEFEVPRAGVVVAEMLAPADIRPSIVLYDDSQDDLETANGAAGQSATLERLIEGGTYYVRLADGSGFSSSSSPDPYRFTLRLDTADIYESNNDFARAAEISLCDTIYGAIFPTGDQDFYYLNAGAGDTTTVTFGDLPPDIDLSVSAYSDNQTEIAVQRASPDGPSSFVSQDSGRYFIEVTARSNQSSEQLYAMVLSTPAGCGTTSANQLLTEGALRLYPNPATDRITVNYGSALGGKSLDLRIYSTEGRELRRYRQLRSGQSLDLADLPVGVLMFQFRVDREVTTVRVVRRP